MLTTTQNLAACAAVAMMLSGCEKPQAEPPSISGPPSPMASASGQDPYEMTVTSWEGPIGEEGYVVVSIEARDGYKINTEYPQKVVMSEPPEGLSLPLRTLRMEHAERESDQRLVFSVPAVPDRAGEYDLTGIVRLSVCNDDVCKIGKEQLSARVVAQ